jgi:membrane dipeptidase
VSDKTFQDVLEASRAPIFASHSSCRALCNHPRNMTDDMIRAVARKGGMIDINFACEFLSCNKNATLADAVAHIDHAVKVGGIGAVGIGSDFDGIDCAPKGLDDVSKFPALAEALREKGYSQEDIRKIFGANFLRFMRAVEKAAGK